MPRSTLEKTMKLSLDDLKFQLSELKKNLATLQKDHDTLEQSSLKAQIFLTWGIITEASFNVTYPIIKNKIQEHHQKISNYSKHMQKINTELLYLKKKMRAAIQKAFANIYRSSHQFPMIIYIFSYADLDFEMPRPNIRTPVWPVAQSPSTRTPSSHPALLGAH